ncbi:hypothetical protein O181_109714 [Austropuccinia psidii MF-1]|uniref:Uncharacterized protein n=1 Tax=Austropuccinia psidii MF-1 TaxID=1389203 RepID=A0A9Q3JX04_9BASI|nr:hypothetical protein [Austropuccinia psidii MF-1]
MEFIIIQISTHKDKLFAQQKREESKEEAHMASTSNLQASQPPQEEKKNKKYWKEPYSPSYKIPRIQRDAMDMSDAVFQTSTKGTLGKNAIKPFESPVNTGKL